MACLLRHLKVLVAKHEVLARGLLQFGVSRVCALPQGYALLPLTDSLLESVSRRLYGTESLKAGNGWLALIFTMGAGCSIEAGPVVFLAVDQLSNLERQQISVWREGRQLFFETQAGFSECFDGARLSHALNLVGVQPLGGSDEFTALGLARYPNTSCWEVLESTDLVGVTVAADGAPGLRLVARFVIGTIRGWVNPGRHDAE